MFQLPLDKRLVKVIILFSFSFGKRKAKPKAKEYIEEIICSVCVYDKSAPDYETKKIASIFGEGNHTAQNKNSPPTTVCITSYTHSRREKSLQII